MPWIFFTILAVIHQSLRTAAQKQLGSVLPAVITAWVRFAFGLPIAVVWLLILVMYYQSIWQWQSGFWGYAILAAFAQVAATVCAVKVLTLRNFAVGTTWIKTEAILTAVVGVMFFATMVSIWIWLAILVSVVGLLLLSVPSTLAKAKLPWWSLFYERSAMFGLAAGLGFAVCSLALREAVLRVDAPYMMQAAVTMVVMLLIQTVVATLWVWQQKQSIGAIKAHFTAATFIGVTSAIGSIGWFTAMALQSAAIVKALGQVEFIVTLLITWFWFNEQIRWREYLGIALVFVALLLIFVPMFYFAN